MAIGTPTDLGGSNVTGIATSATVTLVTTVGASVGDLVVVGVSSSGGVRVLQSVSDNQGGNAYTVDVTSDSATTSGDCYIASCVLATPLPVGAIITATFASSLSSIRGIGAFKCSGIASTNPLDRTAIGVGTSAGWSAADNTNIALADELLVGVAMRNSATTSAPGATKSGGLQAYVEIFPDITGTSTTFVMQAYVETVQDTYRAAGTWGTAGGWHAAFASYKGASTTLTNTVVPFIETPSSFTVGGTLTVNHGTWSPTPSSFNYYWRRADDVVGTNVVEIGATGATYTMASADQGKFIQVGVIPVP